MIELKTIHPYVDNNGDEHYGLMKLYAADENGCRYKILNKKTNNYSDEIVTFYPLRLNLVTSDIKCEKQPSDKKRQPKKERIEIEVDVEPIVKMVEEEPKIIEDTEVGEEIAIEEQETALEETAEGLGEEKENKDEEGEQNNELYKKD